MSRQPRLYPKSQIPGISDGIVALGGAVAPLSGARLEPPQQSGEVKRHHRIFRTKRKHVLKACDRCRVKKTKCDGNQPCNRCSAYNHPCLFRERKATQTKVYSRGFVEMLESHHSLVVKALQKLYKHCINKEGFPGEPLAEAADGHPLTHAILDRLGLIKQAEEGGDELGEDIAESLEYLRHLPTATDCSETADPSPEPVSPANPSSTNLEPPLSPTIDDSWRWNPQTEHGGIDCSFSICSGFSELMPRQHAIARSIDSVTYQEAAVSPTQILDSPELFNAEFGFEELHRRNRMNTAAIPWPNPYEESVGLPLDLFNEFRMPDREQPAHHAANVCYNGAFPIV